MHPVLSLLIRTIALLLEIQCCILTPHLLPKLLNTFKVLLTFLVCFKLPFTFEGLVANDALELFLGLLLRILIWHFFLDWVIAARPDRNKGIFSSIDLVGSP